MNPLLERGNTRLAPLDTVKPCGWINQRGDYVEVARKDTVYGSHTVPLYSRPKMEAHIESLLEAQRAEYEARMAECRKEARKEAEEVCNSVIAEFEAQGKSADSALDEIAWKSGALAVTKVRRELRRMADYEVVQDGNEIT